MTVDFKVEDHGDTLLVRAFVEGHPVEVTREVRKHHAIKGEAVYMWADRLAPEMRNELARLIELWNEAGKGLIH